MTSTSPLSVLAGPDALAELQDCGLRSERIRAFVGASGGPKWLVLHGLDQVVMPWLLGARRRLDAVGSSIGSWRAACLASANPSGALDRMAETYVEQRYQGRPPPSVVSAEGHRILASALGDTTPRSMIEHPTVRLHVVTSRFLHLGALEGKAQTLALGLAVACNAVRRDALGHCVERVVFDANSDPGPFAPWRSLPTRHVALTPDNLFSALSASAAIPMVMSGVVNPVGAPAGTYRDGGVADYHFGKEIDVPDGLTLYPHFYPHMVPGWFDKGLPWRRTTGLRRTILICPSQQFVASLPGGRIPDRKDFERMDDPQRIANWRLVLDASRRLGQAFEALLDRRHLCEVVKPLR